MDKNFNLEEEVRCDFLVDTKRKKIWAVELDILEKLMAVCDKHGLKCYAVSGTLLGAVRHGGFIPWDDDLDVALSREDFDKLCEIAPTEFEEPYFFQDALSDRNYFIGYARLRRSDTTGIITFCSDKKYNQGIYVDIFVYDKIPEDAKQLAKQLRRVKFYSVLLSNYYHLTTTNAKLRRLGGLFRLTKHFISYEKLYAKYHRACTAYRGETNTLGMLCIPAFLRETATVSGTAELVKLPYEYMEVYAPSDYRDLLTISYGDYMQFPPVEQRGAWHEDVIIFDPDQPFMDYYKSHPDTYAAVLKDYETTAEEQ